MGHTRVPFAIGRFVLPIFLTWYLPALGRRERRDIPWLVFITDSGERAFPLRDELPENAAAVLRSLIAPASDHCEINLLNSEIASNDYLPSDDRKIVDSSRPQNAVRFLSPFQRRAIFTVLAITITVIAAIIVSHYWIKEQPVNKPDQLTREQKLDIAAEVLRGERPQSDLKKYGITIGEPVSGEEAKESLLKELGDMEKKPSE